MKKVRFSELSDAIRSFLTGIGQGETVVVEDDEGNARYGVIPYREVSEADAERAQQLLERLWQKTKRGLQAAGMNETDLDRVLQEDD